MISNKDIQKLESIIIPIIYANKKVEKNAYTVTDKEFLTWLVAGLNGTSNSNRLNFRLKIIENINKFTKAPEFKEGEKE